MPCGRLAAPGFQRVEGVFVEAAGQARQDAHVCELPFCRDERFHPNHSADACLTCAVGMRWIGHVGTRREGNTVPTGLKDGFARGGLSHGRESGEGFGGREVDGSFGSEKFGLCGGGGVMFVGDAEEANGKFDGVLIETAGSADQDSGGLEIGAYGTHHVVAGVFGRDALGFKVRVEQRAIDDDDGGLLGLEFVSEIVGELTAVEGAVLAGKKEIGDEEFAVVFVAIGGVNGLQEAGGEGVKVVVCGRGGVGFLRSRWIGTPSLPG